MSDVDPDSILEENVYLLSKKLYEDGISTSDGSDLFVVFISNEQKQECNSWIPLWHQKASHIADGVILWDYHVICVQQKRKESNKPHLVWDLDSALLCPSPLVKYVAETIRPSFQLFPQFQRIVHAPIFLRCFASDRRHMKDSAGNWISAPPSYEAIAAEDGTLHNLNEYMEMSSVDVVKTVGVDTVDAVISQKLGIFVCKRGFIHLKVRTQGLRAQHTVVAGSSLEVPFIYTPLPNKKCFFGFACITKIGPKKPSLFKRGAATP